MEKHRFQIGKELDGYRLDHALANHLPGFSNRRAKSLIDEGHVYVNQKRVRIASRTVKRGEVVEVQFDPARFQEKKSQAAVIQLILGNILYEDSSIIAINKPAGLLTQATKSEGSHHVVPLLEKLLAERDGVKPTLHLAHRLDKETTGVLLLGKSEEAVSHLMASFKERTVEKVYHALSYGIGKGSFVEKNHLSAINPKSGRVKVVTAGGKYAETQITTLEAFPKVRLTLFECRPHTGRSHQIRVHLAHRGFPIVGDKVYGDVKQTPLPKDLAELAAQHHFLHCRQMTFAAPGSGRPLTVEAPYPETWVSFLKQVQ